MIVAWSAPVSWGYRYPIATSQHYRSSTSAPALSYLPWKG
jgi:hypothetical protein